MNNKNVVFIPYNFYIPIENAMWIENEDEIQKSEMILLLGILWRFQNCPRFCSSVIRYWVLYFWKWAKKKQQQNNNKKTIKKTKPKFEKIRNKMFFIFDFTYVHQISQKSVNK